MVDDKIKYGLAGCGGCYCCCCCCCLIIWIPVLIFIRSVLDTNVAVTGTITGWADIQELDGKECELPIVGFFTLEEEYIETSSSSCEESFRDARQVYLTGDSIDILYDPENPEDILYAPLFEDLLPIARVWIVIASILVCGTCACVPSVLGKQSQPEPASTQGTNVVVASSQPQPASPMVPTARLESTAASTVESTPFSQALAVTPPPPAAAPDSGKLPPYVLPSKKNDVESGTSPPVAPAVVVPSLASYVEKSTDGPKAIREWMREYPTAGSSLHPADVAAALSHVSFSLEHGPAAKEIAIGMGSALTCQHVVAAMHECQHSVADVATVMVPYVSDPQNKEMVLSQITLSFQREDIAKLFRG